MNSGSLNDSTPRATDNASALQQAIRHRAIETANAAHARVPRPVQQRLIIIALTLGALLSFVLLINFAVTGVQKIMDIWYPGSISGRIVAPTAAQPLDPSKPFYISVEPPLQQVMPADSAAVAPSTSSAPTH